MMSMALYKREMKGSIKLLVIFSAIITMYVSIIISMYDPELMKTLDSFVEVMPELMASVGIESIRGDASGLYGILPLWLYTADFSHAILHPARKCPDCEVCG